MSAALDYAVGGESGYTGGLAGDSTDLAQMQPFAADPSKPWWQGVITYGITRAIDNRYGPTNVQGNTQPGSFAGTNGRTYTNRPTGAGGGTAEQGLLGSPVVLLALAAIAVFALTR